MDKLISIFWSGKASVQQQQELIGKVDNPDAAWMQRLKDSYDTSVADGVAVEKDDAWFAGMLKSLHQQIASEDTSISQQPKVIGLRQIARFAVAASIALVLGAGAYLYITRQRDTASHSVAAAQTITIQEIVSANHSPGIKSIIMTDGTAIQLYPNSELSYFSNYGEKDRLVTLKSGQAYFKVARSATKPFVVLTRGIQTRDIGTAFNINTSPSGKIVIRLEEGKVAVSATPQSHIALKAIYLTPGQELVLNEQTQQVTLNSFEQDASGNTKAHNNSAPLAPAAALDFAQRRLNEVFTTLMTHYHQKIVFSNEEVKDLWFTGSFTADDSIQTVLSAICNMNGLSFSEKQGLIVISKNK